MRIKSFFIWLIICLTVIYGFNNSFGSTPALGYLLSPSHGFWQQLEGKTPVLPTEVMSTHLQNSVEVVWDSTLIPHIFADTDDDLYFVQGYITASMRLWQMDFQTRAAAGRISEVIGEKAIEFDKGMRRKGMLLGAQKSANATFQNAKVKNAYTQYTAGVNAFIETLDSRSLPLEYKILDMQPESWTPFKSMLLLEYMANMLNTHNNDIEFTNFLNEYGIAEWELLFGGLDDKTQPIVDAPGKWQFDAIARDPLPTDMPPKAPLSLVERDKANPDNGSNNWAVGPTKSANGFAMLANDPHLSLNLPSLWFVVHLNSKEQNSMGASLPGTAGVVIGFNDHISWGFTNSQRDLVDWYQVQFANEARNAIIVDRTNLEVTMQVEEIKVKSGSSVYDTMFYSPFGVIANHAEPTTEDKNTAWAYRWIGQEKSEVGTALYLLNHGQSMADYLDATNHFHSPAQNIVYADVDGNIGIRVQGRFLVRAENEGLFLRDGTKSENQWSQYIPADQNISIFNPDRGFVSSANQYPVDSTYPYFIAAKQFESYRNRRINQVLDGDTSVTVADMKALHNDNFNLEAQENLPYWLAALEFSSLSEEEQEVFKLLMNWNYFSHPEMQEPAYYDRWRNTILRNAWDELNVINMPQPTSYRTFRLLKQEPDLRWWDIIITDETEDAQALIQHAFSEAMNELDVWKSEQGDTKLAFNWGNVKSTSITHLTRQQALSEEGVFIGGNRGIVNATSEKHGPSWRQVVLMKPNEVQAWGIYPGGQSGNPGSAYYTNWVSQWAEGDYIFMDINSTSQTLQNEMAVQKTSFKPLK